VAKGVCNIHRGIAARGIADQCIQVGQTFTLKISAGFNKAQLYVTFTLPPVFSSHLFKMRHDLAGKGRRGNMWLYLSVITFLLPPSEKLSQRHLKLPQPNKYSSNTTTFLSSQPPFSLDYIACHNFRLSNIVSLAHSISFHLWGVNFNSMPKTQHFLSFSQRPILGL
jgi:hypothetical protein